jgi:hypothetical protein
MCLGGTGNFTCSTGHIGPLCEMCDIYNQYTRAGNYQCGNCGDVTSNSLKVVGILIFYIISSKISVDSVLSKILNLWKQT